jgi:hypothetical protein
MIFIENKYTRIYYSIIENSKSRANTRADAKNILGYVEHHHVIPESFYKNRKRKGPKGWLDGNPNRKENLVFLTPREHFLCHLLLLKMCSNTGLILMKYSFSALCNWKSSKNNRQYRVNSRWYEKAKLLSKEKTISEEGRKRISAANKGKITSEETKRKISQSKIGIKRSEETKKKIKEIMKNRPESVLEKIRENNRSPERRLLASKIHKGKIISEKTKKKISESRLKWGSENSKKWKLQTPDNEVIEVVGLDRFCKNNNLCPQAFIYNLSTKNKKPISRGKSKGWMAISASDSENKF